MRSRNSPNLASTIVGGRNVFQQRRRSVISHPVGLSLSVALHGQNPENDNLDSILKDSVNEWEDKGQKGEKALTAWLSTKINAHAISTGVYSNKEMYVKSKTGATGYIDILLSGTPGAMDRLAVVEVGLNNADWWAKFQQGSKYVDYLMESPKEQKEPLLLGTLTLETNPRRTKLGVFLCVPSSSLPKAHYRIIALGYTVSTTLEDASKAFGQFLRTTSWFSDWRGLTSTDDYQYLSSNCCRVGGTKVK